MERKEERSYTLLSAVRLRDLCGGPAAVATAQVAHQV